jgi:hypothetical protein
LVVSAFVNEYGNGLLEFLGQARLHAFPEPLLTMTLFSNGNMMQVLEGGVAATKVAYEQMRVSPHLFNVMLLEISDIAAPTLNASSLGLQRGTFMQLGKEPSQLQLFRLGRDGVEQRMRPCDARNVLMTFADDHAG